MVNIVLSGVGIVILIVVGGIIGMIIHYGRDGVISLLSYKSFEYLRSWNVAQFFTGKRTVPKNLPAVANVEKVSDRVYRILGQNPGNHTLQGTNTYLVTGLKTTEHVLIDTGEAATAKDYVKILFDEVFPVTKTSRLSSILLTHGHFDHQGGVKAILRELRNRKMLPLPIIYKREVMFGKYPTPKNLFECINIDDNQIFQVDNETTLQAIATPGHTDDHMSFILREDQALFTGDCILGCGTTVFDDLAEYMNSLHKMKQLVMESSVDESSQIDTLYPGHGPVIRGKALNKITEYIEHRLLREKEIIQALSKVAKAVAADHKDHIPEEQKWISSRSLTPLVYGPLPPGIFLSAQHNLLHHLSKLEKEGVVIQKFPDLWKLQSTSSH